ncbi:Beta sliding clamp [Vibrio chagasii]|nr:Beta sliding clamp [Vibrio chagasii]
MKFKISKDIFFPVIQKVGSLAKPRPNMPVLSNLLIDATEGKLTVTGTDTELEMVASFSDFELLESGSTTIPAKKLLDLVKGFPAGATLTFTLKDNDVVLSTGRNRYKLQTMPSSDFPRSGDFEEIFTIKTKQNLLNELMRKISFSMAKQDVRYYLNGLFISANSDGIVGVTTDGHRMSVGRITEAEVSGEGTIIMPSKTVAELTKVVDNIDDELEISVSNSSIMTTIGGLTIKSKLVDGKYPDYKRVIPRNSTSMIKAEIKPFIQNLRMAMVLANEKFRGITLTCNETEVEITTQNPQGEGATEYCPITFDGKEELVVSYNGDYLIAALNSIESNEVTIKQSTAHAACLIEDPSNKNFYYVVMPVRI